MNFLSFFIRKIGYWIVSLFILITLTFFLLKIIPGDPFSEKQALRQDMHIALLKHHGLDQSLFTQYTTYLHSILQGDLGYSLKFQDKSVNELIANSFPTSVYLGLQSLIIALTVSLSMGLYCALKPNSWSDRAIQLFMALGISVPGFILATLLQYLFAIKWQLLPLARWGTFAQTILPSVTLAALPTAFMTRLIRNNLLEVLQMDYIKTAIAKGLSPARVLWKHALRNALLPVISYIGPLTANLIVGSFLVEKIFSIPGLGQWYVISIANRDYPVIMGLTLFYAFLLMSLIFIVDLAYGLLDPRIRVSSRNN